MGRSKKSRPAGRQQPATGKKAKPPATPQEAWQQAVAAYEGGRPREAQNLLVPLLDMPSIPGEVSLLAGLIEQQLGDFRRAEEHLRRGLQLVPGRIEGWIGLGNAQHMQGRFDAAIETYRRGLARSPDNPTALYNLAMTFMEYGRHRDALDMFERVLTVAPEWPGAAHNRAIVLGRLGWSEQTRSAYEDLLSRSPGDVSLRLEFARLLERTGRPDEAEQWLPAESELAGRPAAIAQAEELRAQFLARRGDYEGALSRIQAVRTRTGEDFLGYREGVYLDVLGRAGEAMGAFSAANQSLLQHPVTQRLLGRGYSDFVQRRIDTGIAPATAEPASTEPPERRTPVFLIGLPRSGTTLLDRMLGAHPDTEVLEEFDSLRIIESARKAGRSPEQARQAYWEYVDRHVDIDPDSLLIDKNPLHVPHLESLPAVFPDAVVVIALRHPYDAALSCYMQHFDPNPATVHFLDLDSTALLCARLLRLMQLFSEACPGQVVRVRYEDVVTDFPAEVSRVLRAIGLDWHDDVASYAQQSGNLVTTPSYEQVTRELYRSAIGRWQRYRDWIDPFRAHLGPLLEPFGYDEAEH